MHEVSYLGICVNIVFDLRLEFNPRFYFENGTQFYLYGRFWLIGRFLNLEISLTKSTFHDLLFLFVCYFKLELLVDR